MSHASKLKKEAACVTGTDGKGKSMTTKPIEQIIAEAKAKNKPDLKFRCKHPNCIYRAEKKGGVMNLCEFLTKTGFSRVNWHRLRKLSDDIEDCQLYLKENQKEVQKAVAEKNLKDTPAISPAPAKKKRKYQKIDPERLRVLVDRGLTDGQIARLMNVATSAVWNSRQVNNILTVNGAGGHSKVSKEEAEKIYNELFPNESV